MKLRLLALVVSAVVASLLAVACGGRGEEPPPTAAPWITIASNGRYFMFEDGTSFLPLGTACSGEQLSLDYFGTATLDGETVTLDPQTVEKRFQDMQASGENLLRIDIEAPGWWTDAETQALIDTGKVQFLEDPVGTFNEEYARRIDRVLELASQYGIYLDFVLIAHTCQLVGLDDKLRFWPYHISQGGPIEILGDLVTREDVKARWKKRLEYIADRWGGSDRIFNWELWNEMTGCGGSGDPATDAAWVEEMGQHLRDYERARYGRAHLISVTATGYVPPLPEAFLENPGTDIAMHHYYHGVTFGRSRPVEVVKELRGTLQMFLDDIVAYSRPVLENERIIGGTWPEDLAFEAEHNVAWTEISSGSAGAGARWAPFARYLPDTGARPAAALVAPTHQVLRDLLGRFDFASFDSRNFNDQIVPGNPSVIATATSDGRRLIGWLLVDNALDYTIDFINAVRASPPAERAERLVPDIYAIREWYLLLTDDGVGVVTDPYVARIAAVFMEHFGVDEATAQTLAAQLFTNPPGLLDKYRDLLREMTPAERAAIAGDIWVVLEDIITELEALEAEHHTLEERYTGHPEVTTTLAISGLCDGPHAFSWIDDVTGVTLGAAQASGATVTVSPPPFRKHLAFLVSSDCE